MRRPRSWLAAALVTLALSATVPVRAQDPEGAGGEEELSLDALDELMAREDEEDTAAASWTPREIADVVGLGLVVGVALYGFRTKKESWKMVSLVLAVGYLGLYKASLVSIVNVFSVLQGNLPTFRFAVPLYLLVGFTVASTILWGRLYCGRICAFGALTQLMDRVLPSRLRVEPPGWLDRKLVYVKYGVLFAVIAYFLASGDVLVYRYVEPFWVFTFNGNALMWSLAGALLLATVFVRNLYCRYLCSVGAVLGILSSVTMLRIPRWSECQTCRICEKACEWGAIRGPRIVASECVRCDDCERLYADESRCVHWILARKQQSAPPVQISVES